MEDELVRTCEPTRNSRSRREPRRRQTSEDSRNLVAPCGRLLPVRSATRLRVSLLIYDQVGTKSAQNRRIYLRSSPLGHSVLDSQKLLLRVLWSADLRWDDVLDPHLAAAAERCAGATTWRRCQLLASPAASDLTAREKLSTSDDSAPRSRKSKERKPCS